MKKYLAMLCLACGSPVDMTLNPEAPAPAPDPTEPSELATPAGAINVIRQVASVEPSVSRQATHVDPCTLVDGRYHAGVLFTALQINNADPRCAPPPTRHYSVEGTTTPAPGVLLPLFNQRCGCCPATFTSTTRPALDGGTEAVCHVTSSCLVCFNGGDSQMSCDYWFNEEGTFTGTEESVSNGQLCPYVKMGLNNTGAPAKWDGGR
jgi:hypothetical protein